MPVAPARLKNVLVDDNPAIPLPPVEHADQERHLTAQDTRGASPVDQDHEPAGEILCTQADQWKTDPSPRRAGPAPLLARGIAGHFESNELNEI